MNIILNVDTHSLHDKQQYNYVCICECIKCDPGNEIKIYTKKKKTHLRGVLCIQQKIKYNNEGENKKKSMLILLIYVAKWGVMRVDLVKNQLIVE